MSQDQLRSVWSNYLTEQLFNGAITKQYALDSDIIGASEDKKLLKEVGAYSM